MLKPNKKRDQKSLHLANLDKKYSGNNSKDTKMPDVKQIIPISDL